MVLKTLLRLVFKFSLKLTLNSFLHLDLRNGVCIHFFFVHPCVFQVQGEIQEIVKTGLWVGDCFIYTSSVNRLNYYVGGEIVTIAHLDR